jgi:hypothetical protein
VKNAGQEYSHYELFSILVLIGLSLIQYFAYLKGTFLKFYKFFYSSVLCAAQTVLVLFLDTYHGYELLSLLHVVRLVWYRIAKLK